MEVAQAAEAIRAAEVAEAARLMSEKAVNRLPVVDEDGKVIE